MVRYRKKLIFFILHNRWKLFYVLGCLKFTDRIAEHIKELVFDRLLLILVLFFNNFFEAMTEMDDDLAGTLM